MPSLISTNAPFVFELVEAFLVLEASCWPSAEARMRLAHPSYAAKSPTAATADFLAALEIVCDAHPALRFFWKDASSRFLGGSAAFFRDAGFRRPEDILGLTDTDEILPWSRQGAKYIADDRRVMLDGSPCLDILERQDETAHSTRWLRTSKVPVHQRGRVIGIFGGFEIISLERATQLRRTKPQT